MIKPKTKINETPSGVPLKRLVRLLNAITEAVREMERCPDDSTQDIWNESFENWQTGLRMNHRLEIEDEHNVKATDGGQPFRELPG